MSSILKDKKIPAVAVTSLVLGGSCGGGGGGGVTVGSVAQQMCSVYQRCDPDYFSLYYDSLAECTSVMEQMMGEVMDEVTAYYGAACANGYLNLYSCYANAGADCEFTESEEAACYALYDDLYAICGEG